MIVSNVLVVCMPVLPATAFYSAIIKRERILRGYDHGMHAIMLHMPGLVVVQIHGAAWMSGSGIVFNANLIIFINMKKYLPVQAVEGAYWLV